MYLVYYLASVKHHPAIVRSHYDHGLVVYKKYISLNLYSKLEIIQNKELGIITGAICSTPINSLGIEALRFFLSKTKYLILKNYVNILTNKVYVNMYKTNKNLQGEHSEELKYVCKSIDHREKSDFSTFKVQTTKLKVYFKNGSNNSEFLQFVNNGKPDYCKIYTDGLKTEDIA